MVKYGIKWKGELYMSEDKFYFGTESDNMDINEYIKRINEISKYYFEECEKYKNRFYTCCFVRIVASAIIPVISLASVINWSTITVSILACAISISEAYINVTRAYEKWTKYRDTCNLLWIEQRRFSVRASVYSDDSTREKLFIDNCETIMLEEMGEWRNYIERAKEMGK